MKSQLFHLTTFFPGYLKAKDLCFRAWSDPTIFVLFFHNKDHHLGSTKYCVPSLFKLPRQQRSRSIKSSFFVATQKNVKGKTDQELKPKGNFYRSETRNLKCPSLPFFPMGPKEKVTSERKNSFMFQLGSGEIPILSIISITICGQNDTHTIWRVYNSVTIYSFKKKEIVWITHSLKKRQFVKFGECNKKVS